MAAPWGVAQSWSTCPPPPPPPPSTCNALIFTKLHTACKLKYLHIFCHWANCNVFVCFCFVNCLYAMAYPPPPPPPKSLKTGIIISTTSTGRALSHAKACANVYHAWAKMQPLNHVLPQPIISHFGSAFHLKDAITQTSQTLQAVNHQWNTETTLMTNSRLNFQPSLSLILSISMKSIIFHPIFTMLRLHKKWTKLQRQTCICAQEVSNVFSCWASW